MILFELRRCHLSSCHLVSLTGEQMVICETHRIAFSQLKLNCLIPKSNEIQEASRRFVCCLQTEDEAKVPKAYTCHYSWF